ncbi:MAG: N-acetylmuramoyl-L-alanine amidase [Sporomusaceae bacterium]|jgi:hypothetical protein|nr:N-acetylmuramoyl-L-alanine amidase [Sporomusaceae bacterium]
MNQIDQAQLYAYLKKAQGKNLNKVYLHWTAGRYTQVFPGYHICIKGDGEVWFSTDDLSELKDHTWRRNTRAIGIALCCALGAVAPHNFGRFPPTDAQIETLSEVVAIISRELDLPITIQNVMTHAEAADNSDGSYNHQPYGPKNGCERWDLWYLKDFDGTWKNGGEVIRGKANWYLARMG